MCSYEILLKNKNIFNELRYNNFPHIFPDVLLQPSCNIIPCYPDPSLLDSLNTLLTFTMRDASLRDSDNNLMHSNDDSDDPS